MKILFVYHKREVSFVKKDVEILKKRHQVKVVRYSKILDAYTIWKGVLWCNLTFCWFGSIHAFFPILLSKLLAKKSIVVAGGYDVANLSGIKYGPFSFWWKKWCPRFIFRFADQILTVSRSNTEDALKNARAHPEKTKLVYHGFLPNIYEHKPHATKKALVVCVSNISKTNLIIKGLELFIKSSRLLPEVEFILVGRWMDDSIRYLKRIASSNMKLLDEMDQEKLFAVMCKSKVYVQVSRHESFGCALAEAMLCECVPVVTRVAALPEVVGDCGFFLTERSPEKLAVLIQQALNSDAELGKRARKRIRELFPLKKREKALLELLEQLDDRGRSAARRS